jgi:hypothetical protein
MASVTDSAVAGEGVGIEAVAGPAAEPRAAELRAAGPEMTEPIRRPPRVPVRPLSFLFRWSVLAISIAFQGGVTRSSNLLNGCLAHFRRVAF